MGYWISETNLLNFTDFAHYIILSSKSVSKLVKFRIFYGIRFWNHKFTNIFYSSKFPKSMHCFFSLFTLAFCCKHWYFKIYVQDFCPFFSRKGPNYHEPICYYWVEVRDFSRHRAAVLERFVVCMKFVWGQKTLLKAVLLERFEISQMRKELQGIFFCFC